MSFRLNQKVLDSTLYLYPDERSARAGEGAGGSGFMIGYPIPGMEDSYTLWAVTNKHVIEAGHWSIRVNTKDGSFDVIDTDDTQWLFHPEGDDLAVRPLALSNDIHQFSFITISWLLTKELEKTYNIGPGDPCYVVGRFINHEGRQRNTPTARFGQIAQSALEKIEIDGVAQESFLVEIRSIGGYSGSPVFVYLDAAYYRDGMSDRAPDGKIIGPGYFETGPWLLGVDWCMIPLWEKLCDKSGKELTTGYQVPANTGMMGVIPAWRLLYLLSESPAVVSRRTEIENAILAFMTTKTPSAVLTDQPLTAFATASSRPLANPASRLP